MKNQKTIYISLMILDLVGMAAWISWKGAETTPADASPFLILMGVLTALLTLATNQARSESEDYLESACDLLTKCYDTLSKRKDENGRPARSRIGWLTAARLLVTAEEVGKLITIKSHQLIWQQTREYWRGQFRDLINPEPDGFPASYYAASGKEFMFGTDGQNQPLAESSLTALYKFIEWPKGTMDPLKKESRFTDEEVEEMRL